MRIEVKVQTRSSQNKLDKLKEGTYKAYLTCPPVEGKANKALIELVAKNFGIAKSRVRIVKGQRSKNKIVEMEDVKALPLRIPHAEARGGTS